jgi:uncharacterized protein (DUF2336 family)
MSAHPLRIPELDEVVERGSPERRTKTLERLTALFLDGANRFNDDHVQLFDLVFNRLIAEIEARARTELSQRLAPLANAPFEVVRRLARDDDIAVAGPLIGQSCRLADNDLMDIAETKSQAHLLAIAGRPRIAAPVTDVLVHRGNREVAHELAQNRSARLSHDALAALIGRAERDEVLTETIARRPDLSPQMLRDLLRKTTQAVQQRLLAGAASETQSDIQRALADVCDQAHVARDYSGAQRTIAALCREGKLSEDALVDFARNGQYDETIAALAALCAVPTEVVDRLMGAERPDPILILCKSAGWAWPTVAAIIAMRPGGRGRPNQSLDAAYANFERLSLATARRVLRFWQARSDEPRRREDEGPES